MVDANRLMTDGEKAMVSSVFGGGIPLSRVRIHSERWMPGFPNDRPMAPNGEIYFPGATYHPDFSCTSRERRGVFVHEATHLYQYYVLGWSLILRAPFDRDYDYILEPGKAFTEYGLEEMGMIAEHYYILREGGLLKEKKYAVYKLSYYTNLLPIR